MMTVGGAGRIEGVAMMTVGVAERIRGVAMLMDGVERTSRETRLLQGMKNLGQLSNPALPLVKIWVVPNRMPVRPPGDPKSKPPPRVPALFPMQRQEIRIPDPKAPFRRHLGRRVEIRLPPLNVYPRVLGGTKISRLLPARTPHPGPCLAVEGALQSFRCPRKENWSNLKSGRVRRGEGGVSTLRNLPKWAGPGTE